MGALTAPLDALVALVRLQLEPERRDEAVRALRTVDDVDAFIELAAAHRVLPLVARSLVTLAPETAHLLPDAASDAARRAAGDSLAMVRHLPGLQRAFAQAGIPVLAWKGPALAVRAWGDVAARSYDDLDLVVLPADRHRARELLASLGWTPRHRMSLAHEDVVFAGQRAYEVTWPADGTLLELHWAFGARRYSGFPAVSDVLARADSLVIGGTAMRVPSLADTLLLHAVHATKHGWSTLEDVAVFARLRRAGDAAPTIADGARRALALATRLADRVFGESVADRAGDAAPGVDPRIIEALADEVIARWTAGETAWRSTLRWDLAWTDGVSRRARLLLHSAFDPTLQEWRAVPLPASLGSLYRVIRPARLAWRTLRR